jgi:hypothetical protein
MQRMPTEEKMLKTVVPDGRSLRADAGMTSYGAAPVSRKARRAMRLLAAGMLLFGSVYLFHPLVLRWLAEPLTAREARPVDADFICMAVGEDGLAEAVTACHRRPACRIVLIPWRRNRLSRLGLAPPGELQFRKLLEEAGVAGSQIEISEAPIANDWELADRLADRLTADSTASLVILCGQFSGRRWRRIVRDTTSSDVARRIRVQSVEDSVVHLHDWWRSKAGIQSVFQGWLGLTFAVFHGRESRPPDEAPADAYEERSRLRSLSEL